MVWSVNDNNKNYFIIIMTYYNKAFKLNNTNYPRFLFSDIFISKNTIGIISIIYPDVNINLEDIKCIVNLNDSIEFKFNKSIIHRKYESSVYAYIDDHRIMDIVNNNKSLDVSIEYQNQKNNYKLESQLKMNYNLVFTTLFKDDSYLLPLWIEYYLLLGVEHFIVYYNKKINKDLTNLIDNYLKNNKVTLVEWDFVHKLPEIQNLAKDVNLIDEKLKINYHHSQPMSMAHCLHKFGEISNWIGYFDLDEYVILKETSSLTNILKEYKRDKTVSIKFECRWASLKDCEISKEGYLKTEIFNRYNTFRKIQTEGDFYRTKCIVNPDNVIVCGVHRVKKYDKKKYTEHLLNNKNSYFIHFYNFSGGWGGRDKREPLKNQELNLETQHVKLIKFNQIYN